MSILSDTDILAWLREGRISIEPFQEGNLTPNGYDLTIQEIVVGAPGAEPSAGTAAVPPHTWFAVGSREVITLGTQVVGQLWLRTSWARRGVVASFGRVDAGFRGNLTLAAFNAGPLELEVRTGRTFAQLVLEELRSPAGGTYGDRSGRYQDQRGVTAARD